MDNCRFNLSPGRSLIGVREKRGFLNIDRSRDRLYDAKHTEHDDNYKQCLEKGRVIPEPSSWERRSS